MKVAFHRLLESPHTREAVGLVLLVIGLLCFGALVSYDAADSSWFSRSTTAGGGHNWFGWFGATLAVVGMVPTAFVWSLDWLTARPDIDATRIALRSPILPPVPGPRPVVH